MKPRLYLYIVAFVSGGVVLALEILGTRVLGPFYGVSLFLWSALISITLAALSLGYALGGRAADRNASFGRLCLLLAGAAIWIIAIPWLKYPVLTLTEPIGLRAAVLAATFILFFPPLTLLGMVSPFAIKLRAQSLEEVGRSAGDLYAISTIGGVIAALLTGFVLIPNVGVHRLLLSLSALLFITALLGYSAILRRKPINAAGLAAIAAGALFLQAKLESRTESYDGVLGVYQSPYAEIRVVETELGRHMLIDGGIHTLTDPSTHKGKLPYVPVMEIPAFLTERPGDLLLVGLGGGSLAKSYHRFGWTVDAVEIDPRVVELAYKYFGLQPGEANVFIMDGRQYLLSRDRLYDLILIDAFGSSSIPFHLITEEAFGLVASRLREGGILAVNLEAVGWRHKIVLSLAATLERHFNHVLVLPMAEPPNTLGNIIILASSAEFHLRRELPRDYHDPFYRFGEQYHRNHAWDNQFVPETSGAQVITDDLNPVDLWSEEINYVARRGLHEYLGRMGW